MDDQFLDAEWETEVDLTPLIDVIFMLLLFFILASTFSLPALRVALPTAATAAPMSESSDRLILTVDDQGILRHRQDVIAPETIPALLVRYADATVELRVDETAPFQSFLTVLDRLRQSGENDVLITALPES